jgi:eukaryotic translation initiation factor 2C
MHESGKVLPGKGTVFCKRFTQVGTSKWFSIPPRRYLCHDVRINVRLGGINVVPEPQDISFLTDPAHPAMVMGRSRLIMYGSIYPCFWLSGADITHAPPGSRGKPSFTALVGSIDSNAVKYVSRMGVQRSSHEVIEDLEEMCVVCSHVEPLP